VTESQLGGNRHIGLKKEMLHRQDLHRVLVNRPSHVTASIAQPPLIRESAREYSSRENITIRQTGDIISPVWVIDRRDDQNTNRLTQNHPSSLQRSG
jgi:hypothetical protein